MTHAELFKRCTYWKQLENIRQHKKSTIALLTSGAVNRPGNLVLVISRFRGCGGKHDTTTVTVYLLIYLTDSHQPLQCLSDNEAQKRTDMQTECTWFIWSGKELCLHAQPYPRAGWHALLCHDSCAWFIKHPVGFWFVSSCSAALALKTHTCPWKLTHEAHRRIGDEQNAHSLCLLALWVSSPNITPRIGSISPPTPSAPKL